MEAMTSWLKTLDADRFKLLYKVYSTVPWLMLASGLVLLFVYFSESDDGGFHLVYLVVGTPCAVLWFLLAEPMTNEVRRRKI